MVALSCGKQRAIHGPAVNAVADPGGVRWVRTNPPSVPETVTE